MSINPLYIPLFTIEEVILDKDSGLPLAGGVVSFYRDSQRLTPKVVYQISGVSPNYSFISVGSVLTLGLSGTFVDQNGDPFVPYAFPYDSEGNLDLYYVTVVSSGGVPQFVRQAVPYVDTGGISPSERTSNENELSNPQFVEVNFPDPGITILNVTGSNTVTPIAPGWDIVSTGTGTLTLERLQPTSAGVVTNPAYALRIEASTGLGSTFQLRQRLEHTPSIFRNGFASGSFAAAVISGGGSFVSMNYIPSTGTLTEIIASTSIPTDGAYHIIAGNAAIPDQTNSPAATGYVDISLTLPTGRNLSITSVQIVGASFSIDIPYDEQPAGRQIDHLFHYYRNSIVIQPKNTILSGWNFGLNPFQFTFSGTPSITTTNAQYVTDQTIFKAENANTLSVSQNTTTYGSIEIQATMSSTQAQFAVIQYIDPVTMFGYWGTRVSSLVRAFIGASGAQTALMKMRLIYRTTLPSTIGAADPIVSYDTNGDPVFAAGWTALKPTNDPAYAVSTPNPLTPAFGFPFSFNGFQLPLSTTATQTLGIVFYITGVLDSAIAQQFFINEISLVPNEFAIDASPMTFDESLRRCQNYFLKTFNQGVLPASNAGTAGSLSYRLPYSGVAASGVQWEFPVSLRTPTPIYTSYNTTAAGAAWYNGNLAANSGAAVFLNTGNRAVYVNNAGVVGDTLANLVEIHATADARLGL